MDIPERLLFNIECAESDAIFILDGKEDEARKKVRATIRNGVVSYQDYADFDWPVPQTPAMVLAICRLLRNNTRIEPWDLFAAGDELGWLRLAMRYPEMAGKAKAKARTEIATNAGNKAHDKHRKTKAAVVSKYKNGEYKSTLQAASALESFAIEQARGDGWKMSQAGAFDTVKKWLYDSNKATP